MRVRAFIVAILAGAALGAIATSAGAASTYCSQSGDSCIRLTAGPKKVGVQVRLAERYTKTTSLCVKPPNGRAFCRQAPVRPYKRIYLAQLTVPRMVGVYRAGWDRAAWRVSLTVKDTHTSRTCAEVPAPAGPSSVRAINMTCTQARSIVRRAADRNGVAPAGWTYLRPAGCEGIIVLDADVAWTITHGYRSPAGRPAIGVVIYAGCNS